MKRFGLLMLFSIIAPQLFSQESLSIEECRRLAMEHNKTLLVSQEKIKIATEIKKAVFTQFLPNFSATGSYLWNEKNISLLAEDALLPVGTKLSDGSFGFRQDQVNNQWAQVAPGVYAPLDANGKPFDPKAEPGKIMWKDYAYLPKEALEVDMHNVFVGGIGFTQPLFMGGKIREMYNIAKNGEKLAEIQNGQEIDNLLIEVDEAYWRVVSLENKKKLAVEYCRLLEKLSRNVEIMIEEGVATKGDALKVKVKLNEAQMSLTKADNGLRLSKMALNQLCGMDLDSDHTLKDSDLTQSQINPTQSQTNPNQHQISLTQSQINSFLPNMDSILNARPEIRSLNILENTAKSNVKIMESRFMPNLVLSANYLTSNPNFYNGISTSFGGMFSVGVGLNIPLFHFGDRIHTLKAAKGQYRIAQYALDEAKDKIKLQVTQSNFRMIEANRKMEMCENNIEKANENLRFANEAFDEGVISSSDLMEAQTAWLSANSDRIDSRIDVRLCELYLKRANGKKL